MARRESRRGEGGSGRPLTFDRTEATDQAMHLFWRRGYASVSTGDLADAMGIQRSSFYNSFGGKEALFQEALKRYAAGAPDVALTTIGPHDPVTPAITRMFREVCRVRAADAEGRGCLVCNSIAELVGVDPVLGPILETALEGRSLLFARLLAQAAEQGEMPRPEDCRAAGRQVVAFLLGLNTMSKVVRSERSLWRTCREFLRSMGFGDVDRLLTKG